MNDATVLECVASIVCRGHSAEINLNSFYVENLFGGLLWLHNAVYTWKWDIET